MTKNCFRSLLLGVSCLALAPLVRAEWQYGFDESAKYGYIEDAATGCKLWVRSNTSTKLPVYSTVGGVEGFQVYRSDSASAVASLPSGGVIDLSDVATGPAGKPVVSAGWSSFLNSEIVSLRAPDLREVVRDAFNGCGLLEGVEFSSEISVLLGSNSFKGCTNLVTISPTYCPNVTSFGGNFQGLKKLTGDWDFPNVTSGSAMFRNCSSITSIRAAKMTSVGDNFAQNCTSLTNVCLPKLEALSIQCFGGCTSLKSVTLNPEMTSLGSSCFSGCTALEDIRPRVFPNVTVLGQQAFINCSSLRGTLEFTKLGALPSNPSAYAAFQASGLDAVELPALTNISATGTFQKMPNLARVTLSGAGASPAGHTFDTVNGNGGNVFSLYWMGTDVPRTLNSSFIAPSGKKRARVYCRGAAMRAWLTQLATMYTSPSDGYRVAADFEGYGDTAQADYPGEIARAVVTGDGYFWLCDWDYEGDTYDTTIACPENVGLGDVFVDGELILPRGGVYKVPQSSTLAITYVTLNGKLFEDGTGTYVKEGVPAAVEIPASTCDKKIKDVEARALTLSLAELAAKNIAEVTLVCEKDFTCETNDSVVTWKVVDSVAFDLVYGCTGAYRFEGGAKTLTVAYASGITADTAVDLRSVETPKTQEPKWEVVYDSGAAQAYLVNDILGWKLYLTTKNSNWKSTVDGVEGYEIYRSWSEAYSAVVTAAENWELDLSDVAKDTGYPVVRLGAYAFNSTPVRRIIAPQCTQLSMCTFRNCSSLGELELSPATTVLFDNSTYVGCTALTTIRPTAYTNLTAIAGSFYSAPVGGDWSFPNVVQVSKNLFKGCTNPAGFTASLPVCTSVSDEAFYGSTIRRLSLPSVRSVPNSMARGCSQLGELVLSETVTQIGQQAFYNCAALTNLTPRVFPALTNVAYQSWSGCSSLAGSLDFPALTNLHQNSFVSCRSLKSLSAPLALGHSYALSDCTSLVHVVIGGIGTDATHMFNGCKSLTDVYVTEAWEAPATKQSNSLTVQEGNFGATFRPLVFHVRVADDTDYSGWLNLCSYAKDDLPDEVKKISNYPSVRKLLGYVGGVPTLDRSGKVSSIPGAGNDVAWFARWPHDKGLAIILR